MKEGTFDYSSLEKACKRLEEVLKRYNQNTLDDAIRDSVIQRFEFTYSITLKTIIFKIPSNIWRNIMFKIIFKFTAHSVFLLLVNSGFLLQKVNYA